MKKRSILVAIMAIILIIIVIMVLRSEPYYTRKVTIVEVQNQEIVVEDGQGHQWCFGGKEYEVDQEITIVMHNNYTDSIYDDKIVKVK